MNITSGNTDNKERGIFKETGKMSRKGLMEQDLSKLDVTKLHPLSPEVISRQATINIGNVPFPMTKSLQYDTFISKAGFNKF